MNAPVRNVQEPIRGVTTAGVSRPVIVLAVTGTILLALGAFWLSFTTLQDLATLSGVPAAQAWVWPLIVDGVILEATISVVALRNSAATARRFAWLLLAAGAGVSVAANVTHAIVASDTRVPAMIAALVASVPPLVLLAMTHLTVELTRNATPPAQVRGDRIACAASSPRSVERAQPVPAAVPPLASAPGSRAAIGSARRREGGRQEARARALELHAEGVPNRQIAAELQVHPTTVGRWLNAPELQQDGADHD